MRFLLISLFFLFGLTLSAQTWHQLLRENGLPATYITAIRSDNSGNVYIGTTVYGVYKYDGSGLTSLAGLLSNNVRAIECDNSGKVWVGFSSGLSCWDNGTVTNYNTQTGMQSASIYSIVAGSGNVLWIGTGNGLLRYDGMSFLQYTTSNGLPSNMIRALDYDGTNLWIGTSSGLSVYNGVSFSNYTTANGLPSDNIKAIYCSTVNEVWIGTLNGACCFNGATFDLFGVAQGLQSDTVISIAKDAAGSLWFCSNDVISRMNGVNFTYFTAIDHSSSFVNSSTLNRLYVVGNDIYIGTSFECLKTKVWCVKNVKETFIETNMIRTGINTQRSIIPANLPYGLGLEFPKDSGTFTVFNSNLWFAGLDPMQNLHVAIGDPVKQDIFSGPFSTGSIYTNTYDSLYNRIWVISKAEVDSHRTTWNQLGYIIPEVIKNWPSSYALFEDLNGNTIYEPDMGEYPEIRGDRSVLCLYNDDRFLHESGGEKLKVEIAVLYYVYDTLIESIQHTIFANVNITNMNNVPYTDFYMGIQNDMDIGLYSNDYVGCDSLLSCYFTYNALGYDADYINNIPAQGVVFLSSPLYSCSYYTTTSNIVMSDPQFPMDYYYNLKGFWKDGTPYTYGGNGYGGTNATRYVFSGDPVTGTGWTELNALNQPGDRRVLGSIGPFTLDPGKSKCIDFAYVTGRHSSGNNLLSVNTLKSYITEIHQLYNMSSFYCDTIHVNIPSEVDIECDSVHACVNIPTEIHPSVSGLYWPITYSWSPSAGLSDTTIVNPIATVSVSTTYYVTVTDAHGNTDTDSITVIVNQPVLTLDPLYDFCEGERLTLPQYSYYQWSFGYTTGCWNDFYVSGNYWVRARDQYGCWSDTAFFTVNVTPAPEPDLGPTDTLCFDETTILQPGAFSTFLWSDGSTASSLFVNASTLIPGNYLYGVTVTDATGCSGSDQVVIKVIDCMGNETEMQEEATYAYPNPFDNVIKIAIGDNDMGPFSIDLFDATGRRVLTQTGTKPELETNGLVPGFYTLHFRSGNKRNVFRLVKME